MALTASIRLNVPALPQNDVWFANAQAWSNYWRAIEADLEFDPITTTKYNAVAFDSTIEPTYINIDGVVHVVINKEMFDSLKATVTALDQAFKDMRNQLKNEGVITEAQ